MRSLKTILVAAAILAGSCGDNTAPVVVSTTPDPPPTVATTIRTVPPATAGATEEPVTDSTPTTIPATAETPTENTTATTAEADCPEERPARDGDPCPPADTPDTPDTPDTTTDSDGGEEPAASEPVDGGPPAEPDLDADADPSSGGVSEPVDGEAEAGGPDAAVKPPGRVVVYDGIASEETCSVAGGTWTDDQCAAVLYDDPQAAVSVYWHPKLMDDAYHAVDPGAVEADERDALYIDDQWGVYNFLVFYHYDNPEEAELEYRIMREALTYAARSVFVAFTDWVYFPHRYDVSWTDDPAVVSITGTYPLGEQRTLLLHTDPQQRAEVGRREPGLDSPLPLPPPIRPTTPFAALEYPELPDFAADLGRDCRPVEEIWDGYGTEVTDPCTRQAVRNAVEYMWVGDAVWRQVAIRDGKAMGDWLHSIDSIEDPFHKATLGYDSRANSGLLIRDEEMKWAGRWPGASMIILEWYPIFEKRPFTPEEQEAKVRYFQYLADLGLNVRPEELGDEQLLSDIGHGWQPALVVRMADGTWRVSYRSVCWWYWSVDMGEDEPLLCPDDPTPHFPDSAWFDHDIYPPSHKHYYLDRRTAWRNIPHQDGGTPRLNDEYLGVPPS